mmetsp:Transcript_97410/g.275468  ORF Transcript_97410/g.275468 Transcript_97410/m.275468 type:complete len:223 (+) Transcript_97410:115-783(+)
MHTGHVVAHEQSSRIDLKGATRKLVKSALHARSVPSFEARVAETTKQKAAQLKERNQEQRRQIGATQSRGQRRETPEIPVGIPQLPLSKRVPEVEREAKLQVVEHERSGAEDGATKASGARSISDTERLRLLSVIRRSHHILHVATTPREAVPKRRPSSACLESRRKEHQEHFASRRKELLDAEAWRRSKLEAARRAAITRPLLLEGGAGASADQVGRASRR